MRSRAIAKVAIALAPVLFFTGCNGAGSEVDVGAVVINAGVAVAGGYPTDVGSFPGFAFALVNEIEQGASDLNGDGDASDEVVHVINLATGAVTNLGIAGSPGFAANDFFMAWGTEESDQGVDFNMDGDFNDTILTLFNPNASQSATNPLVTGISILSATGIQGEGRFFAFSSSETEAQTDLNGDGDIVDFAVRALSTDTMAVFNAGIGQSVDSVGFGLRNGQLLFLGSEEAAANANAMMPVGADFNGDGDMTDFGLFVADVASQTVTPVGPAGLARQVTLDARAIIIGTAANPVVAYSIPEADTVDAMGNPLNFNAGGPFVDGDTDDFVAAIFDINTATEFLAGGGIGIQQERLAGSETRLVISVPEESNGMTDINNDGDTMDVIPFWIDLANPTVATSAGIAQDQDVTSPLPQVCGEHFVFLAAEAEQGPNGTNFNTQWLDTDTEDMVPHFVDTSVNPAVPFNTTFASTEVICDFVRGEFVTLIANEAANGNFDFTEDFAADDEAIFFFRVTNNAIEQSGHYVALGNGNISVQSCPTHVRFIAFSQEIAGDPESGDMNFDGDFDDWVIQTANLRKSDVMVIGRNVYGTVDPNVAMNTFPFVTEDFSAFPTLESSLGNGAILNDDGDSGDSVLHLLMLDCQ